MRPFYSARLAMQPVTPSNSDALWAVWTQPGLRSFQDLPEVDRARFAELVAGRPTSFEAGVDGRFEWIIATKARPDRPIGWVSVRISQQTRTAGEIGYSIVAHRRGRGYATEAVRELVAICFEQARLQQLRAYCVPENAQSRAVLRNAGFLEEGVLARGASVRGRMVDVIAYVLPRKAWVAATRAQA